MFASDGGTICTLLLVATWRIQRLFCAPSLSTYTTVLPSGEMAAFSVLPLAVRRVIFMFEARDDRRSEPALPREELYSQSPTTAAPTIATTTIAATAIPIG